ncbi:helix-turn-helix domain-containing protein [Streptomyces decoyicus]|uniref:helix-turn-helix domain-containing protein n=1 Tax=Streptomyces decoyicus TaxID=249567 RepID=UPI0036303175
MCCSTTIWPDPRTAPPDWPHFSTPWTNTPVWSKPSPRSSTATSTERRTAQALRVHPNTVDNRLARAAQLTGLDPHTTHGVQLFGTDLTLRRLDDGSTTGFIPG